MNILKHLNRAGDSKIYPEVMDELGIPETADWEKRALRNSLSRMNEEQRSAWDEVYGPMNEEFKAAWPNMSEEDKMHWRYQRYMQEYLGCIAAVDEGVGKVLEYLDESWLSEKTIVVYTSDQGFYPGEHGWFDKRFIYNESFLTPLLIHFYYDVDEWELYDRKADPMEMNNLYYDPEYADVVKDLTERLAELRVKYKDSAELDQMFIRKYLEN